jgi:tetrapyrrole methylase family protein/MazG family protein
MHEESGAFSVAGTLEGITEKLIRRHPHVFGDVKVRDSAEVLENWARFKVEKEGRRPKDSILDGVSAALPVLERACKLQKKAAGAGFDFPGTGAVLEKLEEEYAEVRAVLAETGEPGEGKAPAERLEAELGDLLFSVVNLCRFLRVDPSVALQRSGVTFSRRFRYVEQEMKKSGVEMKAENLSIMDRLWDEAKAGEG